MGKTKKWRNEGCSGSNTGNGNTGSNAVPTAATSSGSEVRAVVQQIKAIYRDRREEELPWFINCEPTCVSFVRRFRSCAAIHAYHHLALRRIFVINILLLWLI